MWDSNPRNLAVQLLSRELRSTTLAIFLCLGCMTGFDPASTRFTTLGIACYATHTIKWYSWNESNIRNSVS